MNAFHVLGGTLAAWALIVSFLGITRENFPTSKGAERAVMAISVILWLGAVGSAIGTAIHEHNEEQEHEGGEHALTLPI
jgi:hypothetical protein